MNAKCTGAVSLLGGVVPHVFALGGVAKDIQTFGECDRNAMSGSPSALSLGLNAPGLPSDIEISLDLNTLLRFPIPNDGRAAECLHP